MNLSQYLEESNEQDTLTLYWRFTVGAAGALSDTTPSRNKGIKTKVRNSAGSYTFTLVGVIPGKLLCGGGAAIGAVGAGGAVGNVTVDNSNNTTTPAVTVVFTPLNSTTATDPTNGVDITVTLTFKNGIV